MRVALLIRSLDGGGAERQAVNLAVGLAAAGHAPIVVALHDGDAYRRELDAARVPAVVVDGGSTMARAVLPLRVAHALRATHPDVVCAYLAGQNLLAAAVKPFLHGAPVVWGVRATNVDLARERPLTRGVNRLEARLSRYADLVVANAEQARADAVERGMDRARMVVIANGIDVDRFVPDPARRAAARASLHLAPDDEVVGRVGRLHPMKDIESAIRAVALLAPMRPRLRLVVVGGGDEAYRRELDALAGSCGARGALRWSDPRHDLEVVYQAFDVLLSSSSYGEAFPNVVGEAMACGVPCVVTDVGDSAAIVGDCGVVVPRNDTVAMASALRHLLDEDAEARARRAARCRARIVDHFDQGQLVDRTVECLTTLVNATRERKRSCAGSQG